MAKVTIKFNAEPHHTLEVEGQVIHGGKTGRCSAEAAAELVTAPYVDIDLVSGKLPEVQDAGVNPADLSRHDLNQLAVQEGVENPENLPKKDTVIAAIRRERETKQPEADGGEGPDKKKED